MSLLVPKLPGAQSQDAWLNDEIINYFMAKYDIRDASLSAKVTNRKRSLFLSCQFMAAIQTPDGDGGGGRPVVDLVAPLSASPSQGE